MRLTFRSHLVGGLCAALLVPAVLFVPMAAGAQSVEDLRYRLGVLDAELAGIRAHVEALSAGQPLPGRAVDSSMLGRLNGLEAEIRRLTGQVEQLAYEQRRIAEDGARRFGDIEFRLTELEGGDPTQLSPVPPLGTEPGETSPPPQSVPTTPAPATAPGEGTLGTLRTEQPSRTVARAGEGNGAISVGESEDLQLAIDDIKQGRFDQAEGRLDRFFFDYPESPLAPQAYYWRGRGHFVRGEFAEAARAHLDGYNADRSGRVASENLLQLGITLGRLGQTREACLTLREVANQPTQAGPEILNAADAERDALNCGT